MTNIHQSADDDGIVGPDRVRGVVQGLLRGAQAKGWTDESLGAAAGISPRRIKSYRVEGREPSLSAALSLGVVLGAPALNSILALVGYGGAAPLEEGDAMPPMQVVAEGMQHFAVIAAAAADGRIDHTERPATQKAADALIATFIPLSSAGSAA